MMLPWPGREPCFIFFIYLQLSLSYVIQPLIERDIEDAEQPFHNGNVKPSTWARPSAPTMPTILKKLLVTSKVSSEDSPSEDAPPPFASETVKGSPDGSPCNAKKHSIKRSLPDNLNIPGRIPSFRGVLITGDNTEGSGSVPIGESAISTHYIGAPPNDYQIEQDVTNLFLISDHDEGSGEGQNKVIVETPQFSPQVGFLPNMNSDIQDVSITVEASEGSGMKESNLESETAAVLPLKDIQSIHGELTSGGSGRALNVDSKAEFSSQIGTDQASNVSLEEGSGVRELNPISGPAVLPQKDFHSRRDELSSEGSGNAPNAASNAEFSFQIGTDQSKRDQSNFDFGGLGQTMEEGSGREINTIARPTSLKQIGTIDDFIPIPLPVVSMDTGENLEGSGYESYKISKPDSSSPKRNRPKTERLLNTEIETDFDSSYISDALFDSNYISESLTESAGFEQIWSESSNNHSKVAQPIYRCMLVSDDINQNELRNVAPDTEILKLDFASFKGVFIIDRTNQRPIPTAESELLPAPQTDLLPGVEDLQPGFRGVLIEDASGDDLDEGPVASELHDSKSKPGLVKVILTEGSGQEQDGATVKPPPFPPSVQPQIQDLQPSLKDDFISAGSGDELSENAVTLELRDSQFKTGLEKKLATEGSGLYPEAIAEPPLSPSAEPQIQELKPNLKGDFITDGSGDDISKNIITSELRDPQYQTDLEKVLMTEGSGEEPISAIGEPPLSPPAEAQVQDLQPSSTGDIIGDGSGDDIDKDATTAELHDPQFQTNLDQVILPEGSGDFSDTVAEPSPLSPPAEPQIQELKPSLKHDIIDDGSGDGIDKNATTAELHDPQFETDLDRVILPEGSGKEPDAIAEPSPLSPPAEPQIQDLKPSLKDDMIDDGSGDGIDKNATTAKLYDPQFETDLDRVILPEGSGEEPDAIAEPSPLSPPAEPQIQELKPSLKDDMIDDGSGDGIDKNATTAKLYDPQFETDLDRVILPEGSGEEPDAIVDPSPLSPPAEPQIQDLKPSFKDDIVGDGSGDGMDKNATTAKLYDPQFETDLDRVILPEGSGEEPDAIAEPSPLSPPAEPQIQELKPSFKDDMIGDGSGDGIDNATTAELHDPQFQTDLDTVILPEGSGEEPDAIAEPSPLSPPAEPQIHDLQPSLKDDIIGDGSGDGIDNATTTELHDPQFQTDLDHVILPEGSGEEPDSIAEPSPLSPSAEPQIQDLQPSSDDDIIGDGSGDDISKDAVTSELRDPQFQTNLDTVNLPDGSGEEPDAIAEPSPLSPPAEPQVQDLKPSSKDDIIGDGSGDDIGEDAVTSELRDPQFQTDLDQVILPEGSGEEPDAIAEPSPLSPPAEPQVHDLKPSGKDDFTSDESGDAQVLRQTMDESPERQEQTEHLTTEGSGRELNVVAELDIRMTNSRGLQQPSTENRIQDIDYPLRGNLFEGSGGEDFWTEILFSHFHTNEQRK